MDDETWQEFKARVPSMSSLLRCDWGKFVSLTREEPHCPEQAARRIVIYLGTAATMMQFCEPHALLIEEETTPHEGVPAGTEGKQDG